MYLFKFPILGLLLGIIKQLLPSINQSINQSIFVFNELRSDKIVCFVDIGEIANYHFLFIVIITKSTIQYNTIQYNTIQCNTINNYPWSVAWYNKTVIAFNGL
jgi:hypothetical protein